MRSLTRNAILTGMMLFATGVCLAFEVPVEKKAEFRKLVVQRNQLCMELAKLDKKAAELLKQGKDATSVNAKQVTTQDRLDLLQLKLETTAARYDLEIPDMPDEKAREEAAKADLDFGKDAFDRGHERTLNELRRQTLEVLRSIDYSVVLDKLGGS